MLTTVLSLYTLTFPLLLPSGSGTFAARNCHVPNVKAERFELECTLESHYKVSHRRDSTSRSKHTQYKSYDCATCAWAFAVYL